MKKIVLGSQSPRRKQLLSMLALDFDQFILPDMDESYPDDLNPENVPLFLSKKKADTLFPHIHSDQVLITADTVVIIDGKILGKPTDRTDARRMLVQLQGRTHIVVTGVSITSKDLQTSFSEKTFVTFGSLSEEQIKYYVNVYQPLDKAGAYGVQEWIGAAAIKRIEGSFYNVMGLPTSSLIDELSRHIKNISYICTPVEENN